MSKQLLELDDKETVKALLYVVEKLIAGYKMLYVEYDTADLDEHFPMVGLALMFADEVLNKLKKKYELVSSQWVL